MRLFIPFALVASAASAGDVSIVSASVTETGGTWRFDVTLEHADEGWDHYADAWRIELADGTILGTRELLHPHVNEQPFTRFLARVAIPDDIAAVYVAARDNVHGWAPNRLTVDLPERQ